MIFTQFYPSALQERNDKTEKKQTNGKTKEVFGMTLALV
jgi:hypothetical protein